MAGPLFLPEMVLAESRFWPNMFFRRAIFSRMVPSRPLLMTDFASCVSLAGPTVSQLKVYFTSDYL